MSTQAEAADQVVKIMLDSGEHAIRIAGAGAKQVAILLYAILKDQKRTKGKVRLNNMLRGGRELRIFPIKAEDLKKFCKEAKKYGVLYCALRQKKNKDGIIDVMARAEDAGKINRIFERLQIATVDMAAVRAEIVKEPAQAKGPDPEDLFVEELFAPVPADELDHGANPIPATGQNGHNLFEASSETPKPPGFDTEQDIRKGRRSVRQELRDLRRAHEAGRKRTKPENIINPEKITPHKTGKEHSR